MYKKIRKECNELKRSNYARDAKINELEQIVVTLKEDLKEITDKEAKGAVQIKKLSKNVIELENVIQQQRSVIQEKIEAYEH